MVRSNASGQYRFKSLHQPGQARHLRREAVQQAPDNDWVTAAAELGAGGSGS